MTDDTVWVTFDYKFDSYFQQDEVTIDFSITEPIHSKNSIGIKKEKENDKDSGIHLSAITAIQKKYEYPVGFADHSPGDMMNYAAVALGASMLEKTITTDKTIEHVEHFMSLELNQLKSFVQNIRAIEKAMGDPSILEISRVEENARRSFVAKNYIKKGEKITRNNLDFKRPGNAGISVAEGYAILGKIASKDIPIDTFLQWDMLE